MNRNAIDNKIYKNLKNLFNYYNTNKQEIGYQGHYEKLLCENFIKFLDIKGYCDAVNSGTSALYLACISLIKNKSDELIISPCTNFGTLSAAIFSKYKKIHLCDSEEHSYQISAEELEKKINIKTRVVIITHIAGFSTNMSKILDIKKKYPWIKFIEDCSQAIGTEYSGKKLGTFGDISCFSTMYRKNLVTGGIGGLIFTRNKSLYNSIRSHSDRGKLFHIKKFDPKNPNHYAFPSLNFNLDEISCFVGLTNLKKLSDINKKRMKIFNQISKTFKQKKITIFKIPTSNIYTNLSIYFLPIEIQGLSNKNCIEIKRILKRKKININSDYHECIYLWKNFYSYLTFTKFDYSNIKKYRARTFNFLYHENNSKDSINSFTKLLIKLDTEFKKYCLQNQ